MSPAYIRIPEIDDTLPKLLLENFGQHPKRVAMRKKIFGIWNPYTWEDCYQNVKDLALGLKALGFERGDKISIIGDNDPEWYWSELAAQAIGGVAVGLYLDVTPPELQFIVSHSESRFAVAKDQEQCDKFLEVVGLLPKLKKVIYWDPKGMMAYSENPLFISFQQVQVLGKEYQKQHPEFFDESLAKGKANDTAVLCYTSGTTGIPKGAMLSHNYLIKNGQKYPLVNPWDLEDEYLSFVPLAWVAEQEYMIGWLIYKIKVNYPEEPETVMENIREIGPQFILLGPRQWQGLISTVQMKMNDANFFARWLYKLSMAIGNKVAGYRFDQKMNPPWVWRFLYRLAELSCLMHIRDNLGLSRLRCGLTGGSALGPDAFRWFQTIGVSIKESYGLTEATPAAIHGNWPKAGTSGPVAPGVEVKISEEGEILIKSDAMFDGYYKQPEETDKILQDGWIKTGDAGIFDEDGHLIILDRVKDLLELKEGEKYSPTYIENRIKYSPYVKDVMVVGGAERHFIYAIVNIDFDNVGRWAEKNNLSYTTFVDLSQKKEVYNLIQKDVERVNKTLPVGARVKKFTLLHKEFDPDEGELTKTRKLRRNFLQERYKTLIEAAYSGVSMITAEADVKYRDGRAATVKTEINIRAVE